MLGHMTLHSNIYSLLLDALAECFLFQLLQLIIDTGTLIGQSTGLASAAAFFRSEKKALRTMEGLLCASVMTGRSCDDSLCLLH